jgi:hypothetical protein
MDFPENVPERDVDTADCCATYDSVAVLEMLSIHHLPEMFNARRVLAYQELANVLNSANNSACVPLQRGFSPANKTGFVGYYLDVNPVAHPRIADQCFNLCNLHVSACFRFACTPLDEF